MQRNIVIGVAVVVLAGTGFFLMRGTADPKDVAMDTTKDASPEETKLVTPTEKGSLLGNALEAFKSGEKMKCSVRAADGSETSFSSEGKKFKSVAMVNGSGYATIFDGTTYYSWDDKTKQGVKFTEACMKDFTETFAKNAPKDSPVQSNPADTPENVLKDTANTSCESVAMIDFSVPSDINFLDQCETMKQTQELLKNIKGAGVPDLSKMNIPGYSAQ